MVAPAFRAPASKLNNWKLGAKRAETNNDVQLISGASAAADDAGVQRSHKSNSCRSKFVIEIFCRLIKLSQKQVR